MKNSLSIALLLTIGLLPGMATADPAAEAGRRILKSQQDAVITAKLVLGFSVSAGGRDQQTESKTETVGTVIDPSGLTVISLSAIDPSALYKNRQRGPQGDFKIDSTVKDAKLVLPDDTEIAAEVVLRDKDLDVAFLRPTEKAAKPFAHIDLSQGASPAVLDQVVCLNRLGKVANRVASVSLERIDALVARPRTFYVLSPGGSSGIGSPVFSLEGAPIGIILIRNTTIEGEANAASMFSGNSGSMGLLPIVVPAADLLEDAKQALEAKK